MVLSSSNRVHLPVDAPSADADVFERTRISAMDIAAIGITNQRETTILWEKDAGEPVSNAIV